MKRPNEEDFLKSYDELVDYDHPDRVKRLAELYGCTTRTVYMWIEKFINKVESENSTINDERDWFDIMKDYKPIEKDEIEFTGSVKLDESCLIICMSDTHMGSRFLIQKNRLRLAEDSMLLKNTKNLYAVFVGDMIDYGPSGPKNLLNDQVFDYVEQKKLAMKWSKEIGHKVLAVTNGCHSFFSGTGEIIEQEFAKNTLTGIYLNGNGILNLQVGNIKYVFYLSHKKRGGSKINQSRGMLKTNELDLDFDASAEAHKHTAGISVNIRRQKEIVVVNCGSYKALDTYASKEGYVPLPLYIPGIYFDAKKKKIIPFMDWRDGLKYINQ